LSSSFVLSTASEEATEVFAAKVAEAMLAAVPDPASCRLLVGLRGELGAGKTAFTRGFVRGLSEPLAREVSSPTYAIVQQYPTTPPVRHVDLYRLTSFEELEMLGYREVYFDDGVVLVEWIQAIPEAIPEAWLEIELVVTVEGMREISVRAHGTLAERIVRRLDNETRS
jgi:tRNA threonylcarbamoyl adenosine modification protein YjeE